MKLTRDYFACNVFAKQNKTKQNKQIEKQREVKRKFVVTASDSYNESPEYNTTCK